MIADPLVGQLSSGAARRVPAGVVVVPAAGVEGVTAEALDPGDPGQLRHDAAGPVPMPTNWAVKLVTPVRGHDDQRGTVVVPLQPRDLGVEQGVVVEAELLPDPLGVLEDLRGMGVLLGRHVPGLLEQRHVDHRRGVALRARIPVPVPGPAEVAALLDDPDVLDAGFPQPGPGDQAGEPTADEGNGDVVGLRLPARHPVCRGPPRSARTRPVSRQVLVVAVRAEALVPLLARTCARSASLSRAGFDLSPRRPLLAGCV